MGRNTCTAETSNANGTGFTPDFSAFGGGPMEHLPVENSSPTKEAACSHQKEAWSNLEVTATKIAIGQKFLGSPKHNEDGTNVKAMKPPTSPMSQAGRSRSGTLGDQT